LLSLVPFERRRDVEIGARLGNELVLGHPILLCQAIEHVMGWWSLAGVAAVVGKPLLCELDVALGTWNLTRPLDDAVPERLQVADLLSLREFTETSRLRDRRMFH